MLAPDPRFTAADRLDDAAPTTPELLHAAHEGEPQREHCEDLLVRRYRTFAHRLAARYAHRGAEADDLRQVADLALVKAIRGFDPEKGEFEAFAAVTISGELKKYFRDSCWSVRPPRRIQELQAKVTAAIDRLEQAGAPVTPEAIAAELDEKVSDVSEAMAARGCYAPTSLDRPVPGGERSLGDSIGATQPDFELVEEMTSLAPACRDLDEDQRELLRLRFGEEMSQREIANVVGVSQMQVSRRLARLLERLREATPMDDTDHAIPA